MDVPSPVEGTVANVVVAVGDVVAEGKALIEVTEAPDEGAGETPESAVEAPDADAAPAAEPEAAPASDAAATPAEDAPTAEPEAAEDAVPEPQSAPTVEEPAAPATTPEAATGTTQVVVPDIGDATDVTVIEIHVQPGDVLAVEDPVVTLESDKASMDVPSPAAGTVARVLVAVGDLVAEGAPLLELTAGAAPAPGESTATAPAPPATEAPRAGEGEPEKPASRPAAAAEPTETGTTPAAKHPSGLVHASPLARRLARELGVDLASLPGTGRNGRITRDDVAAQAARSTAEASPAPTAGAETRLGGAEPAPAAAAGLLAGLPPWPKVDFAKYGEVEVVPLSRIRKIVGANLHRNWVQIPHVTHHDEADVTDLEAFRVRTNTEQAAAGVKVTMVALLLKASVAALRAHPELNASLDGDSLVLKRYYHLGVAVDTPNGLLVPVVRDVDRKGLLEVAADLAELSGKAKEGKLAPGDMQGATFTISSLGGIGGTGFTPIVNAPEVAILGVTRSATRPIWDGSEFLPRLMLPLSLSYDHRVIDGAAAARFTRTLAGVLEDLRRLLL
jgi:pyruvate dehydrogenase E2 component (dihydrolipoamide acetyltransferase)